jgi:hypothetical protein
MEDKDGDPIGPSALFDVNPVPIAHVENALIEGIDRRV